MVSCKGDFFLITSTPAFFPQGEGSILHSNFIHKEAAFSSPEGVRFFVLRSHFVWNYWDWNPFACWLRESFREKTLFVWVSFFLKSPQPRPFSSRRREYSTFKFPALGSCVLLSRRSEVLCIAFALRLELLGLESLRLLVPRKLSESPQEGKTLFVWVSSFLKSPQPRPFSSRRREYSTFKFHT